MPRSLKQTPEAKSRPVTSPTGRVKASGFEGEEGEIRDRLYAHLEDNWDKIFSEENKKLQLVPEKNLTAPQKPPTLPSPQKPLGQTASGNTQGVYLARGTSGPRLPGALKDLKITHTPWVPTKERGSIPHLSKKSGQSPSETSHSLCPKSHSDKPEEQNQKVPRLFLAHAHKGQE